MDNKITLKIISKSDHQFLYDLLLERDPKANISHKKMPTFTEHLKFVKSKPYSKWYVILKEEQKERIKDWLKGDSSLTIKEVKKKIEEEMKVKVSNTTVYNIIKSCGFSYQTPRPRHYKADKVAQEEFKKKL